MNNVGVDGNGLKASEKQGAAAAHASGIFFPLLGPIIVFFLGRKSKYVSYHAMHSFVGMLLLNLFLLTLGAISIGYSVYNLYQHYQEEFKNFVWWHVLVKSVAVWIVVALIGVVNTLVNIVQAIRALNGEWPRKSLTTSIVNRFMSRPAPAIPQTGSSHLG